MHVLSGETIDHVDSMAHAYVIDHWTPSTIDAQKERDRLDTLSKDVNLLDTPGSSLERSSLPGRDDALLVVRTDLAMKASEIMRAVPREDLENMRLVDDSIALDPVRFDLSPQEKASEAARKADWSSRMIESRGAPAPSLIDRGPISDGTASRIARIGEQSLEREWKGGKAAHQRQDTVLLVDRIERLDRNRTGVQDPVVRAAYDLVRNDMALKIAGNIAHALQVGAVKTKHFASEDLRLLRDPHNPGTSGIAAQAAALGTEAAASSKGREETMPIQTMRSGIER